MRVNGTVLPMLNTHSDDEINLMVAQTSLTHYDHEWLKNNPDLVPHYCRGDALIMPLFWQCKLSLKPSDHDDNTHWTCSFWEEAEDEMSSTQLFYCREINQYRAIAEAVILLDFLIQHKMIINNVFTKK
jgi:hypothetical protein